MDLCDPLNCGHRNQRKAERALRSGNISEAIKEFLTAAEDFNQAELAYIGDRHLTVTSDIYAVDTLIAQRQFCLRQVTVLTAKLDQLRRQWSALMEQQKKEGASSLSNLDYDRALSEAIATGFEHGLDSDQLKQRLLDKINEQDSLLGYLETEGANGGKKTEDAGEDAAPAASKCPKSDRTVIEELRQCNDALRNLIVVLLNELESKSKEIEQLKRSLTRVNKSPSHRQRSSTTPSKTMPTERKRSEAQSGNLPDLPPLEFPSLRSASDRESF